MARNVSWFKIFGNTYVVAVLAYIVLLYYIFLYRHGIDIPHKMKGLIAHLIVTHFLLFLFAVSYLQTILREPGKVPLFWGFMIEESETKNRRYCLICHIFKPERCHHCSACNKCILNMDHHCPWLNNCIGFYNRKYFLLLLFFALVLKTELCIYYFPLFTRLISSAKNAPGFTFDFGMTTIVVYILNALMVGVLGNFLRFHIDLLSKNMTTIEHLERKRASESKHEPIDYDIGGYGNFTQVFGRSPWMWLVPFDFKSGLPAGDGVVWPQKPSKAQTYEIDMSVRNIQDKPSNDFATPQQKILRPQEKSASPINMDQSGTTQNTHPPLKNPQVGNGVRKSPLQTPLIQADQLGHHREKSMRQNMADAKNSVNSSQGNLGAKKIEEEIENPFRTPNKQTLNPFN